MIVIYIYIFQISYTNPWLLDLNPSSAHFKCKYLRSSDVNDDGKVYAKKKKKYI